MSNGSGKLPSSILFVCGMNAIRSPMAASICRHLFPQSIYSRSAGVRRGELDPFAVMVMDEVGIDMSGHQTRTIEDLEDTNFDLFVSLAPEAHHKVLELTRTQAMEVEYWPTADPSFVTGSREQILVSYRDLRDQLMERIRVRLS